MPLTGVVPLCEKFDTIGPLTRTVEDAGLLLAAMQGCTAPDLRDVELRGKRFAVLETCAFDEIEDAPATAFDAAIARIEAAGAVIERIRFAPLEALMANSGILFAAEAYGTWSAVIEADPDKMFPQILERFRGGKAFDAPSYVAAWQQVNATRAAWNARVAGFDAVLIPSCPILPPNAARLDAEDAYFKHANLMTLRNTRIGNLLGLCALTLPTGTPSCGLMAMGKPMGEAHLLRNGALWRLCCANSPQNVGFFIDLSPLLRYLIHNRGAKAPMIEAVMIEPERFSNLPEYAFPRLRGLLDVHEPGGDPVAMTIGEPQHAFPAWVPEVVAEASAGWGKYPANDGLPALQSAISGWVGRRFGVEVDPSAQVLALNGTREGLFNAMLALCPETKMGKRPVVLVPNPFYQVYAVAAQAVGAELVYVNATAETGFLPDFASLPEDILARTVIAYICTPSNPQGAVASAAYLKTLLGLAETHDFQIFADECYSEIYRATPPTGTLSVAREMGCDPERALIFHSLSKRSNLPGLRSGFVCGGPRSIKAMKQLRAYAGAPLPNPLQAVATRAWDDEAHVDENRALYAPKYALADRIFGNTPGYTSPEAGFFLWLRVPETETGETAALKLWTRAGLRVLPGAYLARDTETGNPGDAYIRVAMVAEREVLKPALTRLATELDLMRSA